MQPSKGKLTSSIILESSVTASRVSYHRIRCPPKDIWDYFVRGMAEQVVANMCPQLVLTLHYFQVSLFGPQPFVDRQQIQAIAAVDSIQEE